jgi:hypothetical protein
MTTRPAERNPDTGPRRGGDPATLSRGRAGISTAIDPDPEPAGLVIPATFLEQLVSSSRSATNNLGRAAGAVAILLAAIVLTACGSSSSSTLGAAASAAAADGSASGSASGSAASPAGSSAAIKGDSNSKFCTFAVAEQAQEDKTSQEITGDSPQDLQKFEEQAISALPAFVAAAPSAIKSAVQTLAAADQKFFTALKAAGFDYTKLDPSIESTFEDPQFTAAATTVSDYLEQVCGINPTADTSS